MATMIDGLADAARAAVESGFSAAAPVDPAALQVRDEVRAMCAADRCQAYGRSWSCPPAVGSLDESRATLARFAAGLIVQTTGVLDDPFDYDAMIAMEHRHNRAMRDFWPRLSARFAEVLPLGAGACDWCARCPYPGPCTHEARRIQSMESFGLIVSDAARAAGLGYYMGPGTLTYTGCYLLNR